MNRREMFGTLGALGAFGSTVCAHDAAKDATGAQTPLSAAHAHFCGIHMAKNNPKIQVVTQHYCAAHASGVFQCVLFDATGPGAKLLGVEYLISDEAYRKLPDEEKKYWHVHTYEVLGGGLIAPGMEPAKEEEFMKTILTTWGKAWHTWPDPKTAVPMGEPLLIWSLTADGQVDESLVAARDKEFKVDTKQIRERRGQQFGYEPPKVSLPKDMNALGRQWTDSGEDKPTARK
jgi:hypothetical protein